MCNRTYSTRLSEVAFQACGIHSFNFMFYSVVNPLVDQWYDLHDAQSKRLLPRSLATEKVSIHPHHIRPKFLKSQPVKKMPVGSLLRK